MKSAVVFSVIAILLISCAQMGVDKQKLPKTGCSALDVIESFGQPIDVNASGPSNPEVEHSFAVLDYSHKGFVVFCDGFGNVSWVKEVKIKNHL